MRNSNGWAVHSTKAQAETKALAEAIERHLLLKSFFILGWKGFNRVQDIQADGMRLRLLTSRFSTNGQIAGIVAAQSTNLPGVSFGYTSGHNDLIARAEFWQPAIFEAVDKFLILEKYPSAPKASDSWMRRESEDFLHAPFDLGSIGVDGETVIETELGQIYFENIDLREERDLDFPLHACFARGEQLIPLFHSAELI